MNQHFPREPLIEVQSCGAGKLFHDNLVTLSNSKVTLSKQCTLVSHLLGLGAIAMQHVAILTVDVSTPGAGVGAYPAACRLARAGLRVVMVAPKGVMSGIVSPRDVGLPQQCARWPNVIARPVTSTRVD